MARQIPFRDDGGTPGWRARHSMIRRIERWAIGPRVETWSPLRLAVWWFVQPFIVAATFIVTVIVGVVLAVAVGLLP
ncbi:MAG: hypothetical protein J0I21_11710 [Alphaproteobacteria bacterium]|nr:hypothetical protein [Alphaproteobacteria bacterium]